MQLCEYSSSLLAGPAATRDAPAEAGTARPSRRNAPSLTSTGPTLDPNPHRARSDLPPRQMRNTAEGLPTLPAMDLPVHPTLV